jgi:hypothetical protein
VKSLPLQCNVILGEIGSAVKPGKYMQAGIDHPDIQLTAAGIPDSFMQ